MAAKEPQKIGLQDPTVLRQTELAAAQALIISKGAPTVVDNTAIIPGAVATATLNAVAVSASPDPGDIVTITSDQGVYVNAVDQTINNYRVSQGAAQILAGTNITVTSTGGNGTGAVTINTTSTPTFSNITVTSGFIAQINGTNPGNELIIQAGGSQNWNFGSDGNLTLPSNSSSINYANGDPYGGGNANTGQWAFNTDTAFNSTNNGLYISPSEGNYDGGAYFPYSNEAATTRLYNTSGAGIEFSAGANTWQLFTDGSTSFPNSILQSQINDPLYIKTTTGDTDDNHLNFNPKSVDLYAYNSNADSYAELYLDNSNTVAPTASILVKRGTGDEQAWVFANNGSLTLPGAGVQMLAQTNALLTSGISNATIGTLAQGPQGSISWEYLPDGGNANTGYGAVGLSNETLAGTQLNFKIELASDNGDPTSDHTWLFDDTGNLSLPGGGSIYSNPYTPSGAPGNTITLQPAGSGITTNQKLMIYPTAGDGDHIHMVTGNLYQTELFMGSDNFYVKLANTGNVVINANDDTGNSFQYVFGADCTITFPDSGLTIDSGYNTATAGFIAQGGIGLRNTQLYSSGNVASQISLTRPGFPSAGDNFVEIALYEDNANAPLTWTFNKDGNLTIPGSLQSTPNGFASLVGIDNGGGAVAQLMDYDLANSVPKTLLQVSDNVTVTTDFIGSGHTWTFDNTGNLTLPGNLTITGLTNIFGSNTALMQTNDDIPLAMISSNANGTISSVWIENTSDVGNSNIAGIYVHDTGTGAVRIVNGNNGSTVNIWDFGTDGNITLPTGSKLGYAGLGYTGLTGANGSPIELTTNTSNGNTSTQIFLNTNGSLSILTSDEANATSYTWTYSNTGVLTVPGEGIINSIDDTVTLSSSNTVSGNSNSVYLGTSGGLGFADSSLGANWLEIFRNNTDPQFATPGNLLICADSTNTAPTWTFGNDGNFSVPNNILVSGAASPAPYISGFSSITTIDGANLGGFNFSNSVLQFPVLTVDTLPSAMAGMRAFVNDSNIAPAGNFGAVVGNGGSNTTSVWSNGANWLIG